MWIGRQAVRRYQFIEHTADIGLVAYGQTLEEAFANAAYGMFSIIAELKTVRDTTSRRLEINEVDTEGLLFEWLNRLLYFFDVEMLLFRKFDISELDENHMVAVCSGEKYDPARHKLKTGVKSATYHLLKVDREKNQIRVIFDI
ncbi:MAG: archease [Dehalococcoidales bacterium]|nr:archease [Dehalococcoidales bacterium]